MKNIIQQNKIKMKQLKSEINIEFTLDPNYILEKMLTIINIMALQKNITKIVFHFGVINNFKAKNMLKMFALKEKIYNLTEFSFYYLKGVMKNMKNFMKKGRYVQGSLNCLNYCQIA